MENALLTPREVAELLRIQTRAVYSLIRQKKLNALKVGRRLRVMPQDLDSFISEERHKLQI